LICLTSTNQGHTKKNISNRKLEVNMQTAWKDKELDELLTSAVRMLIMMVRQTQERVRISLIDAPYQREVRMEMDTQYNLQVRIDPFVVTPNDN